MCFIGTWYQSIDKASFKCDVESEFSDVFKMDANGSVSSKKRLATSAARTTSAFDSCGAFARKDATFRSVSMSIVSNGRSVDERQPTPPAGHSGRWGRNRCIDFHVAPFEEESMLDFTQPCQPLGSGIRGGCGLASIAASENEFLGIRRRRIQ